MITRAQAEALLSLAESLEACERLDVRLAADPCGAVVTWGDFPSQAYDISAMQLRVVISKLYPKSET